jgi:hypothetical protein
MRSPLLNITAAVILLPIFTLVFMLPLFGVLDSFRTLLDRPLWVDFPILIPSIALYVAAIMLILWKGRLSLGLLAFFAAFILLLLRGAFLDDEIPRRYVLEIGRYGRIYGVDVYCNGVYLGRTPLTISEEEFRRKVKPWEKPPRQDIIIWPGGRAPSNKPYKAAYLYPYRMAHLYYAPYNPFEWHRVNDRRIFSQDLREEIRSARYWWHFEKDGCVGLVRIGRGFVGGGGGGRIITINANPKILYPSVKPHLQLLLHSLRRSDYKPTDEWIAHFRRYMGLLFHEFYWETQKDVRLKDALYAAVSSEFGIDDEMSEDEIERVMYEIMDRAERRGAFTVPSPESIAIDLLGERASEAIEKLLAELWPIDLRSGGFKSGDELTLYFEGRAARFLPLEYAIKRIRPPGLFNHLVYESSRGSIPKARFMALIGNYRREEAVRLVRRYLRRAGPYFYRLQAAWFAAQIDNPQLEGDLRHFLTQVQRDIGFIESRLNLSSIDPDSLADWIYHWTPIPDRGKIRYLSKVNSRRSYTHLRNLLRQYPSGRVEVVSILKERPNPALDQLLIDLYEGGYPQKDDLISAMLLCDTPKIRAYLNELWNRERSLKLLAVPILSRMGMPEAMALLESWANAPDAELRSAARKHLDEHRKLDRQAADLISGRIKPDDLLPSYTPYVWNGQDYVPEQGQR